MLTRDPRRLFAADRRLLIGPAAIAGAWTVVAMAAAVQAVALVRLAGRTDMASAILARLSILPVWALATPLILRSAGRFPVVHADRRPSLAAVAVHLGFGSLFIVLSNLVIRVPATFAPVADGGGIDMLVRSTMQGVAEYFPPALVVYGVIVAIGHWRSHRATLPPTPQPVPDVPSTNGHLTVRQWNRVHLVRVDDIDFVEAEDNYVVVHAASRAYKGRDRISDVESQLDARRFVRIHRSTIVHIEKIREVQPLTHGDHAVILRDGKVLRVARSRRQALGEALGLEL